MAASLFPAAAGRLAVEPSTAYDDVERSDRQALGVEATSRRRASSPRLRMVKTQRGDPVDPATRSRSRFRVSGRPSIRSRPGSVEAEISHDFGGENVVQFGPSSALPHGASSPRAAREGRGCSDRRLGQARGVLLRHHALDLVRDSDGRVPQGLVGRSRGPGRRDREGGSGSPLLRGGRRGAARHREGGLRRALHPSSRARPGHRRARAALHGRPQPRRCSSPA